MDHDDLALGRVLTRREVLALIGAAGMTMLAGCRPKNTLEESGAHTGNAGTSATPGQAGRGEPVARGTCVARPEQTEGPYFVDERLNRGDLRGDPTDGTVKPGVPLLLGFVVSRLANGACTPLANAVVDVWHCDALGVYSDVRDPSFDTTGKKFLRGHQVTDAEGRAGFVTIYPGWYRGRTVHVHFKLRSAPDVSPGFDFTSQLYFDDAVTDQVHGHEPYAAKGRRTLRNEQDGIYSDGGAELMLALTPGKDGYSATFDVALDLG